MKMLTTNNDARGRIREWFDDLGIVIPDAPPIGLRWTEHSCIEIPAEEATDDDLVITPDVPDLDELADGVVYMVHDSEETFPGPRSWRRWRLVSRVSSFLYVSGITASGGGMSIAGCDPTGKPIYHLPSWRSIFTTRRPYLLWKRDWWWHCQRTQGLRLLGRHRPREPYAFNLCAACVPCASCGAMYDCDPDCEVWA